MYINNPGMISTHYAEGDDKYADVYCDPADRQAIPVSTRNNNKYERCIGPYGVRAPFCVSNRIFVSRSGDTIKPAAEKEWYQ